MTVSWPNMNILKIQYGGRPPYWNRFMAITQQLIVCFQRNFAWRSSFSQNFGNWTVGPNHVYRTYFVFLMQFGLRRAPPFVSSPILVLSRSVENLVVQVPIVSFRYILHVYDGVRMWVRRSLLVVFTRQLLLQRLPAKHLLYYVQNIRYVILPLSDATSLCDPLHLRWCSPRGQGQILWPWTRPRELH